MNDKNKLNKLAFWPAIICLGIFIAFGVFKQDAMGTLLNTILYGMADRVGDVYKRQVVFASGYGEVGPEGRERQRELVEAADRLGIAVMGPNCAGFANFVDGIFAFAFLVEERERGGNIGMISQSGQIVLGGLDSPNMGFSHVISLSLIHISFYL